MGLFDKFKKNTGEKKEMINGTPTAVPIAETSILEMANVLLMSDYEELTQKDCLSLPIGELSALGGAVASLIPQLRTVTQTTTVNMSGLYKLANEAKGDALKNAKNGNFWGAFKTESGKSKFVQLAKAEPVSVTSKAIAPIDPATMMMAAAVYCIEQQLGEILEMEKQILSFLEYDKQSEIEADLKILTGILHDYKFNWEKEHYISSRLNNVQNIKGRAEKNMLFYQKQATDVTKSKQLLTANKKVSASEKELENKFRYYRLAVYNYSLASFLEVMLLGNFQEEYILHVKSDIENHTKEYNRNYMSCRDYLSKIGEASIETKVVKGIGTAGKTMGNIIGSIPVIKEGPVDEWLIEGGKNLKKTSWDMKEKASRRFGAISDTGTEVLVSRLEKLNQIYNHTDSICFDNQRIYLVSGR